MAIAGRSLLRRVVHQLSGQREHWAVVAGTLARPIREPYRRFRSVRSSPEGHDTAGIKSAAVLRSDSSREAVLPSAWSRIRWLFPMLSSPC